MISFRKHCCWIGGVLLVGGACGLTMAKEPKGLSTKANAKKLSSAAPADLLKLPSTTAFKRRPAPVVPAIPPPRDPFRTLVIRNSDEAKYPTLPGKQGLVIHRLQLKGIVKMGDDYLALVDTPQSTAAIFLRKNDEVYNGTVLAIDENSIRFRERVVDPLGKPFTQEVLKKLSASTGVSQ